MARLDYTLKEMMVVTASRLLQNDEVVFIGIGLPSLAANLARRLHAPEIVMVYESGTLDTKPEKLPLSIGDDELSRKALSIVSVPEIFQYWLQGGKIGVGFLGAAQVDRFGNINTTIIGDDYWKPKVRLPGGGGAPEIASECRKTFIMLRHSKRNFVKKLDFITSVGYGEGGEDRAALAFNGQGPMAIITDLGVLEPDPETKEFVLTKIHPGISVEEVIEATGWQLKVSTNLVVTEKPTVNELSVLRKLENSLN